MFAIDWDRQQVTCPQGAASLPWSAARPGDRDGFTVRFPAAACRACPARGKCTTSTRRQLFLRPRETHQAVTALRASQTAREWKDRYAIRAGVEGTIRQATAVTGIRTARYHGLPKTSLEHAAATRHQPDPPRRLADQQTTQPDTHHLPPAAHPHHRRLSPQ